MNTLKKIIVFLNLILICGLCYACFINEFILIGTNDRIVTDVRNIEPVDCILILGAGVKDNKPGLMLRDRLDKGIELYQKGLAPKILMSGDHGTLEYDEVNVMKHYAIEKGVLSEDIFMDHAGFSTYDSLYRAKEIFGVQKIIVVSQEYHLHRALYLADKFDIDAIGVPAIDISYSGEYYREMREFLARNKDFLKGIIKPPSIYLGKEIPLTGSGDVTNG